jgi:hypothetical protein
MRIAITLLAFAALFLTASCKQDAKSGAASDAATTTTTDPAAATAVTGAVKHYICPNNCAGSGGDAAGTCAVCGAEYLHNDAFHNQPGQQPAPAPTPQVQTSPSMTTPSITPPPSTDPPQNAAGVWHYTCAKGCAGGSGAVGKCATCGGDLAHNAAYHQ